MAWRDIVNVPGQIVTGFQEAAGIRPLTAAEIVAPFTTPEKAAQSAAGTAAPMGITGAFAPPAKDVVSLTSVAPVTATTPATPRPQAAVAPQVTTVPVAATPDTRPAPTADQGVKWAKAAQDAVRGFGVTPRGQGVPTMEERGLVRDAQGRWVPSEALQQAVEANYQAGVAARNPMVQQAPAIDPLEAELAKYNPTTGFGALAALAAAKSKVASDYTASQNAIRAGERQQELGLRDLAARLQGRELEMKAEEAPALRALREAQTQQAIAEGGYKREQTRLYGTSLAQSAKAAEQKAAGVHAGKIQDAITKLQVAKGNTFDQKQKAEYDAQIAEYRTQLADLAKP